VIFGDGPDEIGSVLDEPLSGEELPALPRLVHRLLGEPEEVTYTCRRFKTVPRVRARGDRLARKAKSAIQQAKRDGFSAAVIVIDRDRAANRRRIHSLGTGRDEMQYSSTPPCAVGMAVETFDAWMIFDADAARKAGGDHTKCHPNPEALSRKEGTGEHPKDVAAAVFGGKQGLGTAYAAVASGVDLGRLKQVCHEGFAPFAADVDRHLATFRGDG
jgi:hypothetical protein